MNVATGTRLGRYEIRSPLGAGGMGEVYLAQDTALDRAVALKILPADIARDEQFMLRFAAEARAASASNHPNIVTIYEIDSDGPAHFIATEYVEGETLRERLARARVGVCEALDIAVQVAASPRATP